MRLQTYFNVDEGKLRADHVWNDADYAPGYIVNNSWKQ
jgi:hypothetical protein